MNNPTEQMREEFEKVLNIIDRYGLKSIGRHWITCDEKIIAEHFYLAANKAAHAQLLPLLVEARDALSRQTDNMAFIINHCDTGAADWYEKWCSELAEDRKVLVKLNLAIGEG